MIVNLLCNQSLFKAQIWNNSELLFHNLVVSVCLFQFQDLLCNHSGTTLKSGWGHWVLYTHQYSITYFESLISQWVSINIQVVSRLLERNIFVYLHSSSSLHDVNYWFHCSLSRPHNNPLTFPYSHVDHYDNSTSLFIIPRFLT